jgi:regulator of RNase E activity RraB
MVPSQEAIRAYTTRLVTLARVYDGEYDGWEAALTK